MDQLKLHLKSHQNGTGGQQCSICHMTVTSASGLTSHMWTHRTSEDKGLKRKAEKSTTLQELLVQVGHIGVG